MTDTKDLNGMFFGNADYKVFGDRVTVTVYGTHFTYDIAMKLMSDGMYHEDVLYVFTHFHIDYDTLSYGDVIKPFLVFEYRRP